MEPQPFAINVPDATLTDLRERLARVRWPDAPPDAGWNFGTDVAYLRELVDYWRDGYDWRAHETRLNAFPQYTAPLAGIDLHFIHQPGVGPDPLPLLLSHGWPGSVWEFHKVIGPLTDPARFGGDPADAFTVVAPSLPGYGFSFRPGQPRFGVPAIAAAFAALMTDVLGYRRFVAQGGDWGSMISVRLGLDRPERVAALHLNFLALARDTGTPVEPSPEEEQYQRDLAGWLREETAYQAIQGTKPQTLAFGLTDSPVGLAAWIVEKFRSWSDCDGDIESVFTKDELLTNIMIYWVTGAIGSSFWPYYDRLHSGDTLPPGTRVAVPTAHIAFPREIVRPPRARAERRFDIRRWTTRPKGGHFAALEQPEALVEDMRAFFRDYRG
jgi:pimeloyl-ACP methyl ester carboxylesterase